MQFKDLDEKKVSISIYKDKTKFVYSSDLGFREPFRLSELRSKIEQNYEIEIKKSMLVQKSFSCLPCITTTNSGTSVKKQGPIPYEFGMINIAFKVHRAVKYPLYEVKTDDPTLPMIIQFFPSFDPLHDPSLNQKEGSEVNLVLTTEEENDNNLQSSISLRKSVSTLAIKAKQPAFAEEKPLDGSQNIHPNS
jgi:hypothetical protein